MDISELPDTAQRRLRTALRAARQCEPPAACITIPDARRRQIFDRLRDDYYVLGVESAILTHLDNLVQGRNIHFVEQDEDAGPVLGIVFVPIESNNQPDKYDTILFRFKPDGSPNFNQLIVFVEDYSRAWISEGLARPAEALFQNMERYLTGAMDGGRRRTRKTRRQTKKKQMRRH